jgi:hypothetical protein
MEEILRLGNKIIAAIIVWITMIVIFIPIRGLHTHLQEYFVHFLFFLIISGLIGLIIGSRTVLYASFGCAAALALFLKNASNMDLKYPKSNETPKFTIAHINLSVTSDVDNIHKIAQDSTIDVISFQEFTPDWAAILPEILQSSFPYHFDDLRMDVYGKSAYSRKPFISTKKVAVNHISFLDFSLLMGNDTVSILSAYITPALDEESRKRAKHEINELENYITNNKNIALVAGEFNQVYWDHDVIRFRDKTKMQNSRREVNVTSMKMPYDHIFYHPKLQCFLFKEISDSLNAKVGCYASYQLKREIKKTR